MRMNQHNRLPIVKAGSVRMWFAVVGRVAAALLMTLSMLTNAGCSESADSGGEPVAKNESSDA